MVQTNETVLAQQAFAHVSGIRRDEVVGYHGTAWVGYVAEGRFREQGASGGLASWVLHELRVTNQVDAVVCVRPTGRCRKLYEFFVARDSAELTGTGRSAYYPVELSGVLREIRNRDGRYAIIGLPCVCKAVRLAMGVDRRLADRIPFLLGLVCGHTVTAGFTRYLAIKAGLDPDNLRDWISRLKEPIAPAFNYAFSGEDGTRRATLRQLPVAGDAWSAKVMTPRACLLCDDVFAETADVVFMDAWLRPYSEDWRGTSLVLTRRPELADCIAVAGRNGRLCLSELPVSQVVASQAGVVAEKRPMMGFRMWLEQEAGRPVPVRRVSAVRPDLMSRYLLSHQLRTVAESHALVRSLGNQPASLVRLDALVRESARRRRRHLLVARLRARIFPARRRVI
jgi:coenzyme F420-reducing hydrogenase beta subunit